MLVLSSGALAVAMAIALSEALRSNSDKRLIVLMAFILMNCALLFWSTLFLTSRCGYCTI